MRALLVIALLVPAAVSANSRVTCVVRSGKSLNEPSSLSALVACQNRKLNINEADYRKKNGADPPDAVMENWHNLQRSEVQDYIRRHPGRAGLDNPKDLPFEEPPYAQDAKAAMNSKQAQNVSDLGKTLQMESDGGKKGVTPEMASQINEYLQKNQGSVSPDMQNLLNSVQKDGPNLSADTVGKLQDAAKQAKQGGLDLDVDKKTEDFLLAPKEPNPNQN